MRPVRDNGCWADAEVALLGGVPHETAGDGHRRCSGSSNGFSSLARSEEMSRRPATGGAATSADPRRGVRAWASPSHTTAPWTVRCARPPPRVPHHHVGPTTPAAPGRGRTRRHRAGILSPRTHDSRGRPPPDASVVHRRKPRRTVHLQLKETVHRAPDGGTGSSDALTVKPDLSSRVTAMPGGVHRPATQRPTGTPPVPDRVVGGRTGLSPRRCWSRSGVHTRGPATRGVGEGGGTRRSPSAAYPGGDAPRAWQA